MSAMMQVLADAGAAGSASHGAEQLFRSDTLFLVVGGAIAIMAIAAGALKSIVSTAAREKTRREIAAYIAEGSMSPEQGEKLMNAGEGKARA
jgi:hypothetical protein